MLVTWTLTVDDATGTSLYRDDELVAEGGADILSFVDTGLDPNTRYEYRIEIARRDGPTAVDHRAAATLAYPPRLTEQRNTHWSGFQAPIVDDLNPGHTEYRVTLRVGSFPFVNSEWSTSRCSTFDGLLPFRAFNVTVVARNLDGFETPATDLAGGYAIPARYTTRRQLDDDYPWINDAWEKARINDLARNYGLTEAAVEWMNNDIRIKWRRPEPGFFGYIPSGYVRVGHAELWGIMHEVMHAFWPMWDEFPEPCDKMNIHTFRTDVARFVLGFREHDLSETPNPWEPWRINYDWMVRLLEGETPGDEHYWDILEREDFYRLPRFFHTMEASMLGHAAGKIDLIPPPLQQYFRRFLQEADGTTWTEEAEWYAGLSAEDRRLWSVTGSTLEHLHIPVPDVPYTSIDNSLREWLRAAERQRLLDFIDTLHEVALFEWWDRDPRFWDIYVAERIFLVPLYLHELDWSDDLELDETAFDAVVESLQSISRLRSGEVEWPDVHELISGIEGLSEPQRTALLRMIETQLPE